MKDSERPSAGAGGEAGREAKTVARAGPAGVLLVAVIVLAVIAAIVFGLMLLGSPD